MDLSSTFTHLLVIVKKFDNEIHSLIDGISYENCLWHILFCQISVYINATLVSTINNFSNYASYVLFILMTSESYRKLRFSANGYPYKTDTESADALKHETICELHLVLNKIFNKPQCLPPNIMVDIKITLAPSNFISRKELPTLPDVPVSLISALLHVWKQQAMASATLAEEKLRARGNNIKLFFPYTITNQRHIATDSRTPLTLYLSMVKFLQKWHWHL